MRLTIPPEDSVVVINIDDNDYQKLFYGRSPLDPNRLQELLDAIAKGKPAIIGVDIDTSSKDFGSFQINPEWPPVIWSREVEKLPETDEEKIRLRGVLGRDDPKLNKNSGLPLLIEDSEDKITRRYRRLIATAEGLQPSFTWAIVSRFPSATIASIRPNDEALFIGYAGDREGSHRFRFSASKLFEISAGWPESSPIKNKIALVGGSYLGQDQHDTPLGKMNGLNILSSVIETELQGGGSKGLSKTSILLLEIFDGFLLLILFHTLRTGPALLVSSILIPLISLVCSRFSFGTYSRWSYFAIMLAGVLLFELYQEYRSKAVIGAYQDLTGAETKHPE